MIEQRLWEHLKLNVPSVSDRVYANIMAQSVSKPALVYTVIEEAVKVSMGSGCNSDRNRRYWEISSYADAYLLNKNVKEEVVAALKSFEVGVTNIKIEDGFDTQEELYVQHITFNTGKG